MIRVYNSSGSGRGLLFEKYSIGTDPEARVRFPALPEKM
jgi:hypothetical protein